MVSIILLVNRFSYPEKIHLRFLKWLQVLHDLPGSEGLKQMLAQVRIPVVALIPPSVSFVTHAFSKAA
jgi:hypothetical protein